MVNIKYRTISHQLWNDWSRKMRIIKLKLEYFSFFVFFWCGREIKFSRNLYFWTRTWTWQTSGDFNDLNEIESFWNCFLIQLRNNFPIKYDFFYKRRFHVMRVRYHLISKTYVFCVTEFLNRYWYYYSIYISSTFSSLGTTRVLLGKHWDFI